jgi:hypothetical protein
VPAAAGALGAVAPATTTAAVTRTATRARRNRTRVAATSFGPDPITAPVALEPERVVEHRSASSCRTSM